MKVKQDDVKAIFELANLEPAKENISKMTAHLDEILDHMNDLNEINVTNIIPFFEKQFRELPKKDDAPIKYKDSQSLIDGFVEQEDDFLIVKKVVKKENI